MTTRAEEGVVIERDVLAIDCAAMAAAIETTIRRALVDRLGRQGVVVAVSGGVDSAVCAFLAVRALGAERVLLLHLPERESEAGGTERAIELCRKLGVAPVVEEITRALDALGCYRSRDAAIRRLFPAYGPGWRAKIAMGGDLFLADRVPYFDLVVESPEGQQQRRRMPADVYRQVIAATSIKQRTRKLIEYTHAEQRGFAVLGTPNRLELELGFFVRGGDGLADIKPIATLYKTQVYALAKHLGVPASIVEATPSTGTYSLPQTQEEFYFGTSLEAMDLLLHAALNAVPPRDAAVLLGVTPEAVARAYREIARKRRAAARLEAPAITLHATTLDTEVVS